MTPLVQTAEYKGAALTEVFSWFSNLVFNKQDEKLSGKLLCVYLKKKRKKEEKGQCQY